MRPSYKSAALTCAAVLLIGASAASSEGSPSRSAHAPDRPTAVTFKLGKRADAYHFGATWRLQMRPGLYLASLRATMFVQPDDPSATEASAICGVVNLETLGPSTRIYVADSTVQLFNGPPAAMSGTAVVRVTRNMVPGAVCFVGSATMHLYQPITVTFTSLGKRTSGRATSMPFPGAKRLRQLVGMR
jgi:hypothetical protein